MKRLLELLRTLGAAGPMGVVAATLLPGAVAADAIDDLRWHNRLVVVFAAPGSQADIAGLDARLAEHACELRERDIVVARIGPGSAARVGDRALAGDAAGTLRNRYRVPPGETAVLLVGKDGGVKLREGAAVDLGAMFDLIDGMPMRQREMREHADAC